MDSAIGLNSDIYLNLQAKLASLTKVCVYDRAGLGLSDRPFMPVVNKSEEAPKRPKINRGIEFTIERMAEDLHHLITTSSQLERPLMFVGSELGAMIARFYAQIYQDKVSHLVLINPLVENLFELDNSIWKKFWYEKFLPRWYSYSLGSAIGLNRVLMMLGLIQPQIDFNDVDNLNRQKHLICNPTHMFSLTDEFVNLNETMAQMKLIWSIKAFPKNVSVTVVTGEQDQFFGVTDKLNININEYRQLSDSWKQSVDFLKTNLHPNSNSYNLDGSVYDKLYKEPDYFFNLIRELIMDWRQKQLLASVSEFQI